MNKVSQTVPYQFDTAYSPFPASEFSYAVNWLAQNGFTGIELAIAYPSEVDPSSLYRQISACHLSATTISTGQVMGRDGLCLTDPDQSVRSKTAEIIRGHIDLSAEIGFPLVTIGLIRGREDRLNMLRTELMPLIEYAFKKKVTLQLEPIRGTELSMLKSTFETVDFIKTLGNPENMGILYDTYHSFYEDNEGGGMLSGIKAAAGRLTNIHFSDSNRGLPGTGEIDFRAVYDAVIATGYKGAFALETLNIPSKEYILENCAASILDVVK